MRALPPLEVVYGNVLNSGHAASETGLSLSVSVSFSVCLCVCLFLLIYLSLGTLKSPPTLVGFRGGSVGKESAFSTGEAGLTPGLGRSPGSGHDHPLQCSGLESPTGRGAWQAWSLGSDRAGHT